MALPAIRRHLESVKDYGTNRYELPADLRDEISERWGEVIERNGYEPPSDGRGIPRACRCLLSWRR